MHDDARYTKQFRIYLRDGLDGGLKARADPDGGYPAPPTLADRIAQGILDASPLRHIASVETITSDALIVQEEDKPEEELDPECACLTTRPLVGKRIIPVHEMYAQPKASQKMVDDLPDIENWIAAKASDIFARMETDAFINGSGVGQPHGLLTCAERKQIEVVRSDLSGIVSFYSLFDLRNHLGEEHAKNAWFIMNRATLQSVRFIRDGSGNFIWRPGLSAGAPDTLLGTPIQIIDDMPNPAPHALAVAVGDFNAGYRIVDRTGVRVLRDPHTDKPFVKFYTTKRVGGDVINPDAIKVLRLAA